MNRAFRKSIQLLGFFCSGMVMVDFFCLSQFLGKPVSKSSMSKSSFASLIVTYWQVCHLRVKIKLIQPRLRQPTVASLGSVVPLEICSRAVSWNSFCICFTELYCSYTAKRKKLWVGYCMLYGLFPSRAHFLFWH